MRRRTAFSARHCAGMVDLVLSIGTRALGAPLALLANLLVARLLGPGQYGAYLSLLSAGLLGGSVVIFGANRVCTREIATAPKERRLEAMEAVVSWSAAFAGRLAVIVGAALLVWLWLGLGLAPSSWPERLFVLLLAPLSASTLLLASVHLGLGNTVGSQMLEPVAKNAALLGVVALMAATSDTVRIGAVLAAQSCAYLFAVVVGFLWVRRVARRLVPKPAVGGTDAKVDVSSRWKVWRQSAEYFFVGSAAVLALSRLDVVLVNGLAGATAAGLFGAANRLIQIAMLGGLVLMGWLQPRIGAAIQDGNLITVRRTLVRGALASVILTLVPVAVCWWFAPWLMGLMGAGFAGSIFPFRLLLLGMAFWGLGFPVGYAFLSVSGGERALARITWLQLIVTVGLVVVFARSHGAVGGAFGYACGIALTSVLAGLATWRTFSRAWSLGAKSVLVGRGGA